MIFVEKRPEASPVWDVKCDMKCIGVLIGHIRAGEKKHGFRLFERQRHMRSGWMGAAMSLDQAVEELIEDEFYEQDRQAIFYDHKTLKYLHKDRYTEDGVK